MNARHFLLALSIACFVTSCASSPKRASHPTVAMLVLQQPKHGWLGISFTSPKHRPQLIARALDGKGIRDQTLPGGLVMPPGPHAIILGSRRQSAASLGGRFGDIGERIGSKYDGLMGRYDHQLSINAVAGREYLAHMRAHGDSFQYWIEDVTTGKTVADTRR